MLKTGFTVIKMSVRLGWADVQTDLHVYCSHIHKQFRFLVTELYEG